MSESKPTKAKPVAGGTCRKRLIAKEEGQSEIKRIDCTLAFVGDSHWTRNAVFSMFSGNHFCSMAQLMMQTEYKDLLTCPLLWIAIPQGKNLKGTKMDALANLLAVVRRVQPKKPIVCMLPWNFYKV